MKTLWKIMASVVTLAVFAWVIFWFSALIQEGSYLCDRYGQPIVYFVTGATAALAAVFVLFWKTDTGKRFLEFILGPSGPDFAEDLGLERKVFESMLRSALDQSHSDAELADQLRQSLAAADPEKAEMQWQFLTETAEEYRRGKEMKAGWLKTDGNRRVLLERLLADLPRLYGE